MLTLNKLKARLAAAEAVLADLEGAPDDLVKTALTATYVARVQHLRAAVENHPETRFDQAKDALNG